MRLVFDIEANNYLQDLTVIHCIVTKNIDTDEVKKFRPNEIKKGLKYLQDAKVLIGHNIIDFDIRAIKKLFPRWTTKAELYDTLIAAKIGFPDIKHRDFRKLRRVMNKSINDRTELEKKMMANIGKHSLEAYGLRLGLHKGSFGKEIGFETFSEDMLEYCVRDVEVNAKLYHRLVQENLSESALDTEFTTQSICLSQTEQGFSFDIDKAHVYHEDLLERQRELAELICKDLGGDFLIGLNIRVPKRNLKYKDPTKASRTMGAAYTAIKFKPFNPNSRNDIAQRLIDRCGWKPKNYGKDGKPTLNEDTLDGMKYPVAEHISEYFMIDKRLGMLASGDGAWLKMYNPETKAIHGRMNTLGCATSRCSHMKPNLGQVPAVYSPWGKRCRELFKAPPNMKLFGTDASGLELRVLAHYMWSFDQGDYADIVLNGDIHTTNQEAAGLHTRDMAKTFMYAKIYGSGIAGLAETCGMSHKAMKKVVADFDKNLPALAKLTSAVKGTIRTRGFIKALDGRKIYGNSEHSALNYLCQSAGAIICKNWMNRVHEVLEQRDTNYRQYVKQLGFIHDELQIAYDDTKITYEELNLISKEAMAWTQEKLNVRVKLDSDSKSGANWAETH